MLWLLETQPPDYSGPLESIIKALQSLTTLVWDPAALHLPHWPDVAGKPILGVPAALAQLVQSLATTAPAAPSLSWPVWRWGGAMQWVTVSLERYATVRDVAHAGLIVLAALGLVALGRRLVS